MNLRVFLISFLLSFSLAYAGTKEDLEQVQRNLLELQRQFWDLEKELQHNNASVQEAVKKLEKASEKLQDNQASLHSKLESILTQIQALNEKLDEANQQMRELGGARAPMAQEGPSASERSNVPSPSSGETAQQPQIQAGMGEQQLYQESMAQYTQGRFEQALRGFQDLLDQYPSSRLSDDAQFMIGESYYGMKEYVDAVTEYEKVIK